MAANIGEIAAKVASRIRDDAGKLTTTSMTGDRDLAILAAREEYEKRRPRERTAQITGSGVFDFQLDGGSPVLAGFIDGFSHVKEVWYPYVSTDRAINRLDDDDWTVVRLHSGLFLRLASDTPTAAEKLGVVYTTPHLVDATNSTVSVGDDEAFADLSASYACLKLAALYAQSSDSTIPSDSVQRITEVEKYKGLAKSYRDAFEQKLGSAQADVPALALATIEKTFPNPALTERFFHQ